MCPFTAFHCISCCLSLCHDQNSTLLESKCWVLVPEYWFACYFFCSVLIKLISILLPFDTNVIIRLFRCIYLPYFCVVQVNINFGNLFSHYLYSWHQSYTHRCAPSPSNFYSCHSFIIHPIDSIKSRKVHRPMTTDIHWHNCRPKVSCLSNHCGFTTLAGWL